MALTSGFVATPSLTKGVLSRSCELYPFYRGSRCTRTPRCGLPSSSPEAKREEVIQLGAAAAVEEYVTSGLNIALGGSNVASTAAIIEAIAIRWETGAIVDVAFKPMTRAAEIVTERFGLPTDFSLNKSSKADLYLASVSQMDSDLNIALGGDDTIRSERFAASIASRNVFLIHEADYSASSAGLISFPIRLDPILPEHAIAILKDHNLLRDTGIRDVCMRRDGTTVADVLLRPGADILTIDHTLSSMPGIAAVGLVPSSERVTAVVASETQSYDITSSLANLATIAASKRPKRLTTEERNVAMKVLNKEWSFTTDGREAIEREFRFKSPEQTQAFVAHVLRTANIANSYPEINTTFNRVHLRFATIEAHGVTQLDIAFANQMGHLCDVLHGCTT